jgi:hypothetical protein
MTKAYLTSIHFRGVTPFKVQVNFDIHLFEGQIDVDAQEKWLNLLESYYSVQKNSSDEKIIFVVLKALPHAKSWWEDCSERHIMDESIPFGKEPTWVDFVDAIKEKFYLVGSYDNQYARWTTLH